MQIKCQCLNIRSDCYSLRLVTPHRTWSKLIRTSGTYTAIVPFQKNLAARALNTTQLLLCGCIVSIRIRRIIPDFMCQGIWCERSQHSRYMYKCMQKCATYMASDSPKSISKPTELMRFGFFVMDRRGAFELLFLSIDFSINTRAAIQKTIHAFVYCVCVCVRFCVFWMPIGKAAFVRSTSDSICGLSVVDSNIQIYKQHLKPMQRLFYTLVEVFFLFCVC